MFLYWKYSIVILYMPILSKISHTLKPNQAPNVAISVGYIISCMSQPFCKVLCSCTSSQSAQNIHTKWFPGVNISQHLPWTNLELNSTWLCFLNKIMTESIRPLQDMMLTFFSVPKLLKSSGYMCNLRCQNDTTLKLYPIPLILKISISGLLHDNYLLFLLLIDRGSTENYQTVILVLLIET